MKYKLMSDKMNKKVLLLVFLLVIIIVGCKPKSPRERAEDEYRTGTQGLVLSFMPNAPREKIRVQGDSPEELLVILKIENKGTFPDPDDEDLFAGSVWLSGFDPNILIFTNNEINLRAGEHSIGGKTAYNPSGSLDLLEFEAKIDGNQIKIDKYTPTLLATTCYKYFTTANPTVCIDKNPFDEQKKVCRVGDVNLENQGAPIAVTKIEEEVLGNSIQFKIIIKNVGNGDVIDAGGIGHKICSPYGSEKVKLKNLDKVLLGGVSISSTMLNCEKSLVRGVNNEKKYIRLVNGEGFFICSLPKSAIDVKSAFTTPLNIALGYYYRNTITKPLEIIKIPDGDDSGTSTGPTTLPPGVELA